VSDDAVARVAALAAASEPAFGETRVLGIDGRSGAGKSTFARAVSARLGAPLIQVESLYEGWEGLDRGIELLADEVLAPLAAGGVGRLRHYDWERGDWGGAVAVHPAPVLVVEGVGVGAQRVAPYLSMLVWLEAPVALRRARALARDGETYRPYWDVWAAQEEALLAREAIADRATLVIRTSG